jgi:tripartite-type tricarboxylate transporter receptor subunit TctC
MKKTNVLGWEEPMKTPSKMRAVSLGLAAALLVGMTGSPSAVADDFYAKKKLTVLIGTSVGGSYDLMGRLTARHIVKFIPGKPSVIVKNMPGSGSLIATNYLNNVAPQDGSVLGCVVPGVILTALFKDSTARYNPAKMQWIGNAMDGSPVAVTFHTSPYKTLEEMKKHQVIVASSGISGFDAMDPMMYNALLGTKFKIVMGYKGGAAIDMSMERGETHARAAQAWSGWNAIHPDWVRDKKIIPFLQLTLEPIDDPRLKGIPRFIDVVKPEDRALAESYTVLPNMGRPTVMAPGVPKERVAIMRAAYAAMVKDADFIAEAKKQRVALKPIVGEKLQKMVETVYSLNETQAKRLYKILQWDKRGRKKKKK